MSLIDIAESDLAFVLEDDQDGFGVEVIITTPAGLKKTLTGQSTDIGVLIDPSTGVGVIGRNCEIVFRISTLLLELGEIPKKSESGDDWYVFTHTNTNGETWNFGIEQVHVDRKLGIAKFIIGLVDISL
jgi:hypothetical protein